MQDPDTPRTPRLRRLIPSPAVAVATIALTVALGGTGYAAFRLPAGSVGTAQLRNGAVTAQKVRAHSLLAKDFKLGQLPAGSAGSGTAGTNGATGPAGAGGAAGPAGPPGPQGSAGPAGTARAYGLVSATGGLSAAKNVSAVTHPSTGIYCITPAAGISTASTTLVATPDENGSGDSREIAHIDSSGSNCPAGAFKMELRHLELDTATSPYTIVAHHSDSGFSFVIP